MEEKKNAGMLYLPKEHQDFCREIHGALGAAYRMAEEAESGKETLAENCGMSVTQNEEQCSLTVCLQRVGADLERRMEEIHLRYPLAGMQTANIFLNINDENAVWAYRRLVKSGYFFAGLRPLCAKREYMVLHHRGEVEICFEEYALTGEFRKLIKYIKERMVQNEYFE